MSSFDDLQAESRRLDAEIERLMGELERQSRPSSLTGHQARALIARARLAGPGELKAAAVFAAALVDDPSDQRRRYDQAENAVIADWGTR